MGSFPLAIVYAADNGASIAQNSWGYGTPGTYNQVDLDAIDYFNTNGGGNALLNGGLTVFSAGNSNFNLPRSRDIIQEPTQWPLPTITI